MQQSTLKIKSSVKNNLIEFLSKRISHTYRNDFGTTSILAGEEYRFRTNSNQLYFIVLETTEPYLYINIVCGGGGEGLFNFSWGSEKAFINRAKNLIVDFCKLNSESYEEVK